MEAIWGDDEGEKQARSPLESVAVTVLTVAVFVWMSLAASRLVIGFTSRLSTRFLVNGALHLAFIHSKTLVGILRMSCAAQPCHIYERLSAISNSNTRYRTRGYTALTSKLVRQTSTSAPMSHRFYSPSERILNGKALIAVSNKTVAQNREPQRILQPIVSTANVGQLAADLLISSLDLHRIGIFNPRDLVPVVGAREDDEPGVTTPLERNFPALRSLPILHSSSQSTAVRT